MSVCVRAHNRGKQTVSLTRVFDKEMREPTMKYMKYMDQRRDVIKILAWVTGNWCNEIQTPWNRIELNSQSAFYAEMPSAARNVKCETRKRNIEKRQAINNRCQIDCVSAFIANGFYLRSWSSNCGRRLRALTFRLLRTVFIAVFCFA